MIEKIVDNNFLANAKRDNQRALVRYRFAGFHNANPMIGELTMSARYVDLRHMTCGAIFVAHRACRRIRILLHLHAGVRTSGHMTRKTLRRVVGHFLDHLVVGIMTGDAGDALVTGMAATIDDSIRLVSNVDYPTLFRHQQRFLETHMTRAAKLLREFIRVQGGGIEDLQVLASDFNCGNMSFSRSVTSFARYTRHELRQLKFAIIDRCR
jgi:hypothetical protein